MTDDLGPNTVYKPTAQKERLDISPDGTTIPATRKSGEVTRALSRRSTWSVGL